MVNLTPANFTKLNGRTLLNDERVKLKPGDAIQFAKGILFKLSKLKELEFVLDGPASNNQPPPAGTQGQVIQRLDEHQPQNVVDVKEERISLTNPGNWINEKARDRIHEASVLQKFAQGVEEKEKRIQQIQLLEERRRALESWVSSLREKSKNLHNVVESKKAEIEEINTEIQKIDSDLGSVMSQNIIYREILA